MVAVVLMAYGIGLALGEAVRERVSGGSRATGCIPDSGTFPFPIPSSCPNSYLGLSGEGDALFDRSSAGAFPACPELYEALTAGA